MDLLLIHKLESAVVCRPEDWIRYVPTDDLGYFLRDTLFDFDCRKMEDILTICFVLSVAIFLYLVRQFCL